jgi:ribosomal-protein-alanine N-acetyltransferase
MNEAITGVIEYAFYTLGLTTIDALSHKDNQGSIKLLQKLNLISPEYELQRDEPIG